MVQTIIVNVLSQSILTKNMELDNLLVFQARQWLNPGDIDYVYYHKSCTDGAMAAAVALLFNYDIEVQPFGYEQDVEDLRDLSQKNVLFVDVALTKSKYDRLVQKCKRLLVLDHHATSQSEISGQPGTFFDMDSSGCTIAWKYFFPSSRIPLLLQYVEQRDLWKMNEESRAFTTFFYNHFPTNPQCYWSILWSLASDAYKMQVWMSYCTHHGKKMELDKDKIIQRVAQRAKMVVMNKFPNISVCAVECNDHTIVSDLGSFIAKKHGIALIWSRDDKTKMFKGSLRSVEPHDSSIVAKLLGGGGHKHASGFVSYEPIIGHHFLDEKSNNKKSASYKRWVPRYQKPPQQGFDKWANVRTKKYHSTEM